MDRVGVGRSRGWVWVDGERLELSADVCVEVSEE